MALSTSAAFIDATSKETNPRIVEFVLLPTRISVVELSFPRESIYPSRDCRAFRDLFLLECVDIGEAAGVGVGVSVTVGVGVGVGIIVGVVTTEGRGVIVGRAEDLEEGIVEVVGGIVVLGSLVVF